MIEIYTLQPSIEESTYEQKHSYLCGFAFDVLFEFYDEGLLSRKEFLDKVIGLEYLDLRTLKTYYTYWKSSRKMTF